MGLFPSANDFKAGKGVEKDAPRKTGIGRFFELVGRDMNGMFLANLLACIGFLPVICLVYIGFLANSLPVMLASAGVGGVLAGPALAGMYDTVLRALRDEAGYWWTTYRKAFKQNFKASILPGVLYCVVVTVQIFLVYFCFNLLYHGTNVGVGMWVATVLNLVIFHMQFSRECHKSGPVHIFRSHKIIPALEPCDHDSSSVCCFIVAATIDKPIPLPPYSRVLALSTL